MTELPARMPTMKDVAQRAGVSRQLVSMVLRNTPGPSASSRESVLKAADELNYFPNASARLLRQERSHLIGVYFDGRNAFESRFVERLLERAAEDGYGIALGPATTHRTTDVVIAELLERRVVAIGCFNPDPGSDQLERAIRMLPVVWLGERSRDPRVTVVRSNQEDGIRLAVEHLASLGHTRICYVGGLGGLVGPDRLEAYQSAMSQAGLAAYVDPVTAGFFEEDGAAAGRTLLGRRRLPTAVIAGSDSAAAGLFAVFSQAGVRVPEDVSLVGYDDSDIAALSYHSFTSVRQDVDLTVEAMLGAIYEQIGHNPGSARQGDQATQASLTVRTSTARPREAEREGDASSDRRRHRVPGRAEAAGQEEPVRRP